MFFRCWRSSNKRCHNDGTAPGFINGCSLMWLPSRLSRSVKAPTPSEILCGRCSQSTFPVSRCTRPKVMSMVSPISLRIRYFSPEVSRGIPSSINNLVLEPVEPAGWQQAPEQLLETSAGPDEVAGFRVAALQRAHHGLHHRIRRHCGANGLAYHFFGARHVIAIQALHCVTLAAKALVQGSKGLFPQRRCYRAGIDQDGADAETAELDAQHITQALQAVFRCHIDAGKRPANQTRGGADIDDATLLLAQQRCAGTNQPVAADQVDLQLLLELFRSNRLDWPDGGNTGVIHQRHQFFVLQLLHHRLDLLRLRHIQRHRYDVVVGRTKANQVRFITRTGIDTVTQLRQLLGKTKADARRRTTDQNRVHFSLQENSALNQRRGKACNNRLMRCTCQGNTLRTTPRSILRTIMRAAFSVLTRKGMRSSSGWVA